MSYFLNAAAFLIQTIFSFAIGLFLVRVLLLAAGASFYEPICRFVYQLTNPVITPLRRCCMELTNTFCTEFLSPATDSRKRPLRLPRSCCTTSTPND